MPIKIRCAWCGLLTGIKDGEAVAGFDTSHTICPSCAERVNAGLLSPVPTWSGTDRRLQPERRRRERRNSLRCLTDTLIIIDGITLIDGVGVDRRHKVRRQRDREWLAEKIIDMIFNSK